ncbi:hypothetical protein EYF80_005109 [Liparis tanakae]|uniref:Uncharacterized protein n=1 Tax=Liparis tanakae TaxID=230148 RepID=A0A4Z2J475_9TELE|nr:hypothetical protein EYF80_005109 [Liparis tanakae]
MANNLGEDPQTEEILRDYNPRSFYECNKSISHTRSVFVYGGIPHIHSAHKRSPSGRAYPSILCSSTVPEMDQVAKSDITCTRHRSISPLGGLGRREGKKGGTEGGEREREKRWGRERGLQSLCDSMGTSSLGGGTKTTGHGAELGSGRNPP